VAGMAISHTGTSLPHGLSYMLTYEYGIPHGKAVGVFLPNFLEAYLDVSDVENVLKLLGFEDLDEFRLFLTRLLGEINIPEEVLLANGKTVLANQGKMANYPFPMSEEEMADICRL